MFLAQQDITYITKTMHDFFNVYESPNTLGQRSDLWVTGCNLHQVTFDLSCLDLNKTERETVAIPFFSKPGWTHSDPSHRFA